MRKYKKISRKTPQITVTIKKQITIYQENPLHPSLRLHKIFSKKIVEWSISITDDLRLIFQKVGQDILLTDIGTHDEIY